MLHVALRAAFRQGRSLGAKVEEDERPAIQPEAIQVIGQLLQPVGERVRPGVAPDFQLDSPVLDSSWGRPTDAEVDPAPADRILPVDPGLAGRRLPLERLLSGTGFRAMGLGDPGAPRLDVRQLDRSFPANPHDGYLWTALFDSPCVQEAIQFVHLQL